MRHKRRRLVRLRSERFKLSRAAAALVGVGGLLQEAEVEPLVESGDPLLESVLPVFLINLLAFVTGVAMLVGLVRRGIWGAF